MKQFYPHVNLCIFSKFSWFLFSMILCVSINGHSQSYCITDLSYYGCGYYAAIDNFSLSNINQIGTGCQEGTGVTDYTTDTCILAQGEPYLLTYTTNTGWWNLDGDCIGLWIDLNDDFDFDDEGEFIYSSIGPVTNVVAIPGDANLGYHRMRARCKNDYIPFNANESCLTLYYSETHDYTVNMVPPPPCPSISSITVSDIGFYTATVNITCNICNGPFIIEYGLSGFTPGTEQDPGLGGSILVINDISAFPAILSDLASSSEYHVYVRRDCNIEGYSSNFGPAKFNTAYEACATIYSINCGTPVNAYVTTGKGEFDTTNCGVNTGKELMYSFTADQSGIYTLTILETDYKYASYMVKETSYGCDKYNWNCGQVNPWTYNYNSPQTIILDTLTEGTSYYLCFDATTDFQGANHTFRIDCYVPFNPCDSVTTIICGENQHVIIPPGLGVFSDYNNGYSFNYGREKLYRFIPEITGAYHISIESTSSYDAMYYSFKNASEGCDVNGWHFITGMGSWGTYNPFAGTLIAGTEYYFLVDAGSMSGGDQYLTIHCYTPSEPCAEVDTITCGTTVEVNIPSGAGHFTLPNCPGTWINQPFAGKENLFLFTPETSGYASLNIMSYPSPFGDNYLYYYIKPAAGGCNDEGWTCITTAYPGYYKLPMYFNAGESYYLLVDGMTMDGNTNTFTISCPEPWDPCSSFTDLTCTTSFTASIPPGAGVYDTLFYNHSSSSSGRELIYRFAPDISGTYALIITATDYKQVKYLIKEASTGCNENGWEYLSMNSYPTSWQPIYLSNTLSAGTTYYIMLDAGDPTGATHTFEIQCVYPADPCTNITPITCGSVNSVINEHGLGIFDPVYWGGYHFPGRETLFEFTPEVSGNHMLQILSATGSNSVGYFIKPAAGGCNNENWTFIATAYYQYLAGIPVPLVAGTPYYVLADSYTEGQTFSIVCPAETYDYCSTIETIPGCGTDVSFTIPPGLGAFGLASGCNNYSTPGKEKLFSFTPSESGYYGIEVLGGTGLQINYCINDSETACTQEGWTCISSFSSYGGNTRMPYKFIEGHTYYFIMDAYDTLGCSQSFRLICPAPDPCLNITEFGPCGDYHMINLPAGINNYDLPGCGNSYQTQTTPKGSFQIFSFTPQVEGVSLLYTAYLYNASNIRFFIRPASSGCGEENWTCINYDSYSWRAVLPYPLIKDTAYYLMIGNEYLYGSGEFGVALACPDPCLKFRDNDFDGYGNDIERSYSCWPQFGYVYEAGDCDDYNPEIYPGAPELIDDIDNDCDGQIDDCVELPVVTCPADMSTCILFNHFQLTGGTPEGGTYTGIGVTAGIFNPSEAGAGNHLISYCYTNESGCSNCCQFQIYVLGNQEIALPQGWSGISSYIDPGNPDIVDIFNPILSNLVVLYNFTNVYYPEGGINPTESWSTQSGYVVKMTQSDQINICGPMAGSTILNIQQGWNIIPVLSSSAVPVDNMFGSIPEVDIVMEVAGDLIYWKQFGINSLLALEPGKAYFVHSSGSTSASFPSNGDQGLNNPVFINHAPWNEIVHTNINHVFAFTRQACESFKPGDEIGIFTANGRCAGRMTLIGNDQGLGLIAHGDDIYSIVIDGFLSDETVTFKVFSPSTGNQSVLSVEYDKSAPNGNLFRNAGISVITKATQSALQVSEQNIGTISIYPNPSEGIFTIAGISESTVVTILRASGSQVSEHILNTSGKIDLSGQPAGIYLIRLTNQKGTEYRKVVKD